ncbi:RagB/SusD family nutrient uptake outer membrane protein [Pseudoflavitalea sp. X16]|uniref:RagB/SusD family nutrient uptake outer membrane protein n=1 Tax=Paraflavitalea devenefica TaxID=2716334 RepID=UPI0014226BAF|nr:RagB/SusD family nutrient uptake outer membrane protein [Paraflavitalea devenefica]NII25215.1 RagB/SusD family nutrient uptake outer membrane protein [Paraflavitalea devenefica]
MKTHYILFIILIAVTGVSCSKFLDRKPITAPTDENFWSNEDEANNGIAGAYVLLRKALNEGNDRGIAHHAYGDLPTDQFVNTLPGEDWGDIGRINWSLNVPLSSTWRSMMKLRRFDNFYRVIDQANRCIKYIPGIALDKYTSPDAAAAQKRLIGEAYFLRAFTYFYMARIWGDVPLVLETVDDVTQAPPLPRTGEAAILDQCIKDLNTATGGLTWTYASTGDRAVRANRGAAYALLAHIYAWREDYPKCAVAADSVITHGGYTLVNRNDYLGIYKGKSTEGIFEIAQSAVNEGSAGSIAFATLKSPYLATNLGNTAFTLDANALHTLFPSDTDLRVAKGFAFFNTADPVCIKYSNILYTQTNSQGQPSSPIALNNMVVFRLADIMLLRAEALAATAKYGEARTLVETIRTAAGATPLTVTDDKLFEAVIDERGRELFLEGHRFYDLVRLARKTGILKFDGSGTGRMTPEQFQQGKYKWPIDPILISNNPLLQQTGYWKTRM